MRRDLKATSPTTGLSAVTALIYCDIDGVLHPWPCPPARMFDTGCIAGLAVAVEPYDVELVVTSTWRLEWLLEDIRAKLGVLGSRLVGATPEIEDPFVRHARYHEVLRHREQHALTPWVAIDDEAGRYPADLDNLVLTDPRTGFSDNDAVALVYLLERERTQRISS